MRCSFRFQRLALCALLLFTGPAAVVWAVPYASGVRNIGGANWEFVLNEAAELVTVLRDGGNSLTLPGTVGRHMFSMTNFTNFSIEVSKSAPAGWTSIGDPANPFANFTLPSGLAINTNPTSQYFGTVYVANANPAATQAGRQLGDGVYALTADMKGVDLASNFAVVTDANDVNQAKAPGWTVNGSTTASPWRMTMDAAGNLIVSDWSDADGGIKYAAPDLATGGLVLRFEDGVRPLFINDAGQEVHGSIASKPYVTGSVGNNLTVYAMDEDFDLDGETLANATTGNHVWRWNVGNATNYDQPPSLVVSASAIPNTSDNRQDWLNLNVGVRSGAAYDPGYNKWYLIQNRADGNQSGLVVVTPDGVDGMAPTKEWSSLQFSIDSMLDGHNALPVAPAGDSTDIQDVFRSLGDVTISPDRTKLYLHKIAFGGGNTIWSLTDGEVIEIPLDENGLPDIEFENGRMTNVRFIDLVGNNLGQSSGAQMEFDAAGNLYVANSGLVTGNAAASAQLVQVFSPGGNWKAVTRSDGTFSVQPLTAGGVLGDYNGNGTVDAADYVTWRNGGPLMNESASPGAVDGEDYTFWRSRFGAGTAGGAQAAVPEPSAILLLAIGIFAAAVRPRVR